MTSTPRSACRRRARRRPAAGGVGAIIWYLAEGSSLVPADPYERAQVLQWMFFEQYVLEPTIAVVRFWVAFSGRAGEFADQIPVKMQGGYAALDGLERGLEGRISSSATATRSRTSPCTPIRMSRTRAASTCPGIRRSTPGSSASPRSPGTSRSTPKIPEGVRFAAAPLPFHIKPLVGRARFVGPRRSQRPPRLRRMTVRVRFAPSPTGSLHLGNALTAAANRRFADDRGGTLVLRIDDTDASASSPVGVDAIVADLDWLGIAWDEGPVRQSDARRAYADAAATAERRRRRARRGRLAPPRRRDARARRRDRDLPARHGRRRPRPGHHARDPGLRPSSERGGAAAHRPRSRSRAPRGDPPRPAARRGREEALEASRPRVGRRLPGRGDPRRRRSGRTSTSSACLRTTCTSTGRALGRLAIEAIEAMGDEELAAAAGAPPSAVRALRGARTLVEAREIGATDRRSPASGSASGGGAGRRSSDSSSSVTGRRTTWTKRCPRDHPGAQGRRRRPAIARLALTGASVDRSSGPSSLRCRRARRSSASQRSKPGG